jgi:hypothetical protein
MGGPTVVETTMTRTQTSPNDSTIDKICLKNVVSAISRRNADALKIIKSRRHGQLLICAEQNWLERVRRQAERQSVSLADYIRQTLVRQLLADEGEDGAKKKSK